MIWLVFGCIFGIYTKTFMGYSFYGISTRGGAHVHLVRFSPILAHLTYAAPAIGGLVVVGQMITAYGNCITLF